MNRTTLVAISALALTLTSVAAADCTKDGKFPWYTCYGLSHSVGEVAAIKIADVAEEALNLPEKTSNAVGWAGCGYFVYRETQGRGNLVHDADRFLDWVAPCAVALFYDPGSKKEVEQQQLRLTNVIDNQVVSLGVTWKFTWD